MRRHTTHSLILTAALAFSLAPALHAQNGYYRPDGRATVFPDTGHLDRVSAVAHQIDETALSISRQYSRNNRRPNRDEYRALERLRDLSTAAAQFHDQVETNQRQPRNTVDDFARLERAFYAADRSLGQISPRPYVDSGMNRIHDLMNELGGFYGRRAGYYGAWGHDRDHDYDHDNGYRPPRR